MSAIAASHTPWRRWWREGHPMVIKEARQMVRSQGMVWLLLVSLLALLGHLVLVLTSRSARDRLAGAGDDVLAWQCGIMTIVLVTVIPIYTAIRLHIERHSGQLELVVLTGLRDVDVLRGKFRVCLLLQLLLLTVFTPFAFATVYLRGVGLVNVAGCLVVLALASAFASFAMVMLGGVTRGWLSTVFACVLAAGNCLFIAAVVLGMLIGCVYYSPLALVNCGLIGFLTMVGLLLYLPYLAIAYAIALTNLRHNRTGPSPIPETGMTYSDLVVANASSRARWEAQR